MRIRCDTRYVVTRANSDNSINIGDSILIHKSHSHDPIWKYTVTIPHTYKGNIHNQLFVFKTDKELIPFIQPLNLVIDKDYYMQQIKKLKKRIIAIKELCYDTQKNMG